MNRLSWISRCAFVGALVFVGSLSAPAQNQDDIFGDADPLTPAAEAAPLVEKSVLAAERPAEPEADRRDFCRCVGEAESVAVARIEAALRGPLKSNGLDYTEQPLQDIVMQLQDDYGIPIQLDLTALEEIGLAADEQVTVNLHNISLRSALRLMLKQFQLTYIIQDEVLMITTPESAESQMVTCVYDVQGITDDATLIDTIVSCVCTETWKENGGGQAEIRPLKPGLLVISQTRAVHEEVQSLLETIRTMRRDRPAATDAAAANHGADEDQVVTRSYVLQVAQVGNMEKMPAQLRELIVKSIPDEKWDGRLDDGQPVVLTILPDRVVLRHTPPVHEQVQALLSDSGIAMPAPPDSDKTGRHEAGAHGEGGGGGFF